ncbi:MAG: hypothetical protein K6F54_02440 [Lachnospiraceae bacterium]|nr:hypothetical protein [Lachnospiraceae bacterium]
MRNGSLPSNIYDRAVYKPIYKYNKDRGTICAADSTSLCFAPVTVSGEVEAEDPAAKEILNTYMLRLIGNCIAAFRAVPDTVGFDLTLPVSAEESDLRTIMGVLIEVCSALDMSIGKTIIRSSEGVSVPQIYMTAYPVRGAQPCLTGEGPAAKKKPDHAGAGIVMTGFAGASGTVILSAGHEEDLKKHFNDSYCDRIRNVPLAGTEDLRTLCEIFAKETDSEDAGTNYIRPVGEGGVYAALWDLSEDMKLGFDVELKSIPILQETVELCNCLDADPYELRGDGAFLIVTADPEGLMGRLSERNMDSALIGCLTRERSRAIINRDEIRCLNRPDMDEILRLNITESSTGGI